MSKSEVRRFHIFVILRALVGNLDLIAILAVGFLSASVALFLAQGNSPNESIDIGPFTLPTISIQSIPLIGLIVLALFISKAVISIFLTHKLAHFLAGIEARAAKAIAIKAYGSGLDRIKLYSRNEILFAVGVGSPNAFNTLLNSVSILIAEGFLFLLVILAFSTLSLWVAASAIVYFSIIGLLIQYFIGRELEKTSLVITDSSIESSAGLLDLGEVIREATTLNKKNFFIERVYKARVKSAKSVATQLVLQGAPRHIVETALILGIGALIVSQALVGDLANAAGVIGVFLAGGLRLVAAMLPLQNAFLSIKQSIPLANRAFDLLELPDKPIDSGSSIVETPNVNDGVSITLDNLVYSYGPQKTNAINGISLEILPGTQVAFIGPSGAGKTTLADLILGLLKPSKGHVLLGGQSPEVWMLNHPGLIGYVPQRPGMVSGTIAENIALGQNLSEIDVVKLRKAIQDAHLGELIHSLPDGAYSDMGKNKGEFSGGQLQRIGLARALYNSPKILIMDEATSALDAESESEINKAVDEMRGTVTVILIAHRLNTIQRSDMVFLIEAGQLSDSGTFPDLLRRNETVKSLAELMSIDSLPNEN
jgi:ATP-binding cassette subfamily C protein